MAETTTARASRLGRGFRLLQTASAISGIGDGLVLVAFPLLATTLTDDPRLVVAVTVAERLPWLLLSLPAGALVDRGDRRRMVVVVEAVRTLVLVAFALTVVADHAVLPALLATVFLIGAGQTVIVNATHAVLPQLVEPPALARANGVLFSTQTATENLIGPALGGVLFAAATALPFVLDGLSFAVAALLFAVALPATARVTARPTSTRLRADMAEGFAYFLHSPLLELLAGLVSSLAFCQAIVFGPLVLFALQGLGLSDAGYGVLLAVAAIGNVVGGTVAGRLDDRFGARVLLPATGLVAAAAYGVCGLATNWVVAGAALALEAVAVAVGNVANLALRQRRIPNELLGRVGGVFRFFIYGAIPLGALLGGFLVDWLGVRAPLAVAAVLQGVLVAVLAPPLVRRLGAGDLRRAEAGC
jgi:MFS family permease